MPLLLASFDCEGRYLFANRRYAERFGLEPSSLIGRNIEDIVGPAAMARLRPYIAEVLAGRSVTFEVEIDYPDASGQCVRSTLTPMVDAEGSVTGWHGAAENVTASRRVDARLRQFEFVLERTGDFVGIADLAFRPLFVNQAGAAIIGADLSKPFPDTLTVFAVIMPEHHQFLRDEFFPRVLCDGSASAEVQFRNVVTGQGTWMDYSVVRLDDAQGRPTGYATISRDLTDSKRVEARLAQAARESNESRERLTAALDASDTGTFRWQIDTNELEWDDKLKLLFGLTPTTPVKSFEDFIHRVHPDDRERVIQACVRSARDAVDFQEEFRTAGESPRWLSDRGRVYRSGDRIYMTGACTDITERRLQEEALRAADRQKDEFLGMLSHELRTPLAPMAFAIALLARGEAPPEHRRPLEVLTRQVQRLRTLVDELLDISRARLGKIRLERERIDMRLIVSHAVEAARPLLEARRHALDLRLGDDAAFVLADRTRLGQVVDNLLANAAKYTPDQGTIRVVVEHVDTDIALRVRDSGVGIDPSRLQQIFELFGQEPSSHELADGGLGIGLALVERLVHLHGGRVEALSEGPGTGAEFVVRLPAARASMAATS